MLEWAKISKSVMDPIISANFNEHLKVVGRSFLSAFSLYSDCNQSLFSNRVLNRFLHFRMHFIIFIGMFVIILFAVFAGRDALKYPIILLACLHLISVLLCSIGHAVLDRYLEKTEWALLLSFMLALWSLFAKKNYKDAKGEKLMSKAQGGVL
jgi:hypothetical protein